MLPLGCSQLLIVAAPHWNSLQAELEFFEKNNEKWELKSTFPVVLGQNGLAHGKGWFNFKDPGPIKKEGDGRSPAGCFFLGTAFGKKCINSDYPFIYLDEDLEAIDDCDSQYYNQIVKVSECLYPDWKTSEKMSKISSYEYGVVVYHNWPQPLAGLGSAIFLHLWSQADLGTLGCTAMHEDNLMYIIKTLKSKKFPCLLQGPENIIKDLKKDLVHF